MRAGHQQISMHSINRSVLEKRRCACAGGSTTATVSVPCHMALADIYSVATIIGTGTGKFQARMANAGTEFL